MKIQDLRHPAGPGVAFVTVVIHAIEGSGGLTGPRPRLSSLAIAGSLAGARVHASTRATLDTTGPTFCRVRLGVIVIVGGLIYFPMLILGPIGERFIG